ncbi:MAG: ABC transporter substrate-binding protein [Alistipes sp.]|nr:ABC transporter substrate-binding protein [Alistipes sp.]
MKRLAQIVLFVVVALLSACSNNKVVRETEPIYTPRYAQGFAIERDKASGELLLCVKNPWQGAEGVEFYSVINHDKPAKRIVAMSSSHSAMLEAIGCSEHLVGISGCRYISSPTICKAIEEGKVVEVGYDSALDFERIKSLQVDAVLLYGVAGEAKVQTNKFNELGIPYIYIGDYLETSPLGKAEWVVAVAYICGLEEQGKEFFKGVEERYNALRNQKHCSAYRPRVMLNLPYRDTWFMPPHNSYMVRLIEDAGGEYILTENGTDAAENENLSTKSTPISLEEALVLAMKADFWINLGQIASKAELCATAPRFAGVDAVKFGRLYNNTKRTNDSRGSDFWESGAVRPDIILEDLIKILHYEAPTDSLYYYKKLGDRS